MSQKYIEEIIEFSHQYAGKDGKQRLEAEILGFLQ
jgi:hypothetical protein